MRFTRLFAALTLTALSALVLTSPAFSWPFFYTQWNQRYPASQTDDNILNGGGSSCQICHRDPNGGDPWNPYGWALRNEFQVSGDIVAAMLAVEALDSDMDPTGASNLDEIDASTQPGWTPGPNNTIHFENGSTQQELPPNVILGDLDPPGTIGTSYCGPAVPNSSGQSAVISATGSIVAADDDLTLHAADMPQNQFGYFLASQNQGFFSPPASAGNICLGANIGRYAGNVQNSGTSGAFSLQIDLSSIPVNPPQPALAGESWNFQCWYRDAPTNNFTDGLNIVFQ